MHIKTGKHLILMTIKVKLWSTQFELRPQSCFMDSEMAWSKNASEASDMSSVLVFMKICCFPDAASFGSWIQLSVPVKMLELPPQYCHCTLQCTVACQRLSVLVGLT